MVAFPDILTLLTEKMGLDSESIGINRIRQVVQMEQARLGVSLQEYAARIRSDVTEQEHLLDALVVPETWFFRGKPAFAALSTYVNARRRMWVDTPLRILSVPCSTGEEPCTIAITLSLAGLSPNQFHIDALDISRTALQKAKTGEFYAHSFRGVDTVFRKQFFKKIGERRWQLHEKYSQAIHFQYGNVSDADFLADASPYDVIFCRNLLIYLTRPIRQQLVNCLHKALKKDGRLFCGHSELSSFQGNPPFHIMNDPGAFMLRKATVNEPVFAAQPVQPAPVIRSYPVRIPASGATRPVAKPANAENEANSGVPLESTSVEQSVQTVRQLADQGCLQQAAEQCDTLLKQHPSHAELLYIRGVIYDAAGDAVAAEHSYQKVLYINPRHKEALSQLLLLAQLHNHASAVEQYSRRLSIDV